MMNALIGLGLGIIIFALIAGVGVVVLHNFGKAVSSCPTGYTYNANNTATFTDNNCCLNTGTTCSTAGNFTEPSTATNNNLTMMGYVNSNLITWIPAVIALGIGLLFIGSLMGKKNKY